MQTALARLRRTRAGGDETVLRSAREGVAWLGFAWGGAACALLFSTLFWSGGLSFERFFWIGSAAILLAGVALASLLLGAGPLPKLDPAGLGFLVALLGLAAWSGASLAWSVVPDLSWAGFDRSLAYLAYALIGVLVGALLPSAPRLAAGVFAGLVAAVIGWALLGKIFPALYPEPAGSTITRLRNPIGYWNALALLADVGLALALWIATPRRRPDVVRASGALLFYLAVVAVLLTYSRTGIVVAAAVFVAWLVLAPQRLEGLVLALAAGAPAVGVAIFAFTRSGLSHFDPHSARVHDGAWFGVVLLVGAILTVAAALAASRWERRRPLEEQRRRFLERRIAATVAVGVVAAVVGLALRAGGPGDWWREFTNPVQVSEQAGRFGSASSNNRWTWWGEAWRLFEAEPLRGHGAASFAIARRPIRESPSTVTEPHNTALQFLSELGLLGFLLGAAAAVAALSAAAAALRRARERDRLPTLALSLALWIYLVHALVDFDWEFVAVTGPVLFIAGLLAAAGRPTFAPRRRVVLAGVAVVAMLASLYSLGAPWLAERRVEDAYAALDRDDVARAVSRARSAHRLNPLSYQPYWALAGAALAAGDTSAARVAYEKAAILQPENSDTWYVLGEYEFRTGRLERSCYALDLAYRLDPQGIPGRPGGLLDQVKQRLPGCPASAPPP